MCPRFERPFNLQYKCECSVRPWLLWRQTFCGHSEKESWYSSNAQCGRAGRFGAPHQSTADGLSRLSHQFTECELMLNQLSSNMFINFASRDNTAQTFRRLCRSTGRINFAPWFTLLACLFFRPRVDRCKRLWFVGKKRKTSLKYFLIKLPDCFADTGVLEYPGKCKVLNILPSYHSKHFFL